ncbi:MAG: hypothetical protein EBX52_06345 [Proteobacteria bacterium]|nr:hypothetical protein [Pseudomonadota bacterium]
MIWIAVMMIGGVFPVSHGFSSETAPEAVPGSPLVIAPLSDVDKKKILATMKQQIQKEEKDLETAEKSQRKDVVRSQGDRKKEWREKEKKARRAFFESHGSGPERRAYVQDFVKRREAYDHQEKVEWTEFKKRQKENREALDRTHRELTQKVNEALSRGQRPEGF